MSKSNGLPARIDVPIHQTWDLESIFPSPEAWEQAYKEVEAALPELQTYQGRLAEGAEVILACFDTAEKVFRLAGKVMVYGSLQSSANSTDQEALGRADQGRGLIARAAAAGAFIDPELAAIGFDRLRTWMQQNAGLSKFQQYVENLERQQKHVRSADVEQLLAMVSDPLGMPFATFNMLVNADLKFSPAVDSEGNQLELGQSSIDGLRSHADRKVRQTTWENYSDGYLAYKNTLASTVTGAFKRDVFYARARSYGSALEASLAPNNIPVEVFNNLIAVFKQNLPTWHRYWRLRKKLLGYDTFHVYDIKAPLVKNTIHVPYEQAVEWICEGMAPLGDEYVRIMRNGCLEGRWVDYARNKGKREGAFSSGTFDTHPFIMMSYSDNLYSLSTLAHELGHSMHSYNSRATQSFIYSRYGLFVAEVASNFNQAMVREHLFATQKDPDFQIGLVEEAMSNFHRYFFIMPTLARFEVEVHQRIEKGAPVNADYLTSLTADLFAEGYGDEVVMDRDRIGITWAQFLHMYMNFYVYQYATGISGAHTLADMVIQEGDVARDRYLEFLKAGSSVYPLTALKRAGVDMTAPEPVERAFATLADYVDRLEQATS